MTEASGKIGSLSKGKESVSKETKPTKKNQTEILEMKNAMKETKIQWMDQKRWKEQRKESVILMIEQLKLPNTNNR